jgi:hypothetical protein
MRTGSLTVAVTVMGEVEVVALGWLIVTVVALAVTERSSALESTTAPRSGFM